MRAEETAGPEGQRARASVRDGTIPNPQRAEGCGRWGPGGPWCRWQCSPVSRRGTQGEGTGPALARLHQPGVPARTSGLLQKGEGRARGLAHVRRVWRVAVV